MNVAKRLLITIHIHIYENCSANMLSVTHFSADYKGAEPGQPVPAKNAIDDKNVIFD